jgi:hypothetical protein
LARRKQARAGRQSRRPIEGVQATTKLRNYHKRRRRPGLLFRKQGRPMSQQRTVV